MSDTSAPVLVIAIDTEADDQWRTGRPIETRNLEFVPRFQDLCDRYALRPTYLCTYEIVRAAAFARTLRRYQDDGRAEVGAHLHPWTTPPLPGDAYDLHHRPFPSELPVDAFAAKVHRLTEAIAEAAGRRPTSYRAGRWGFAAAHVPVLVDLGYRVDASVTPLLSWASTRGGSAGGPDFRRAPVVPYALDPRDVCRPGDSPLLEVPCTILTNRPRVNRLVDAVLPDRDARPARLARRALRVRIDWFRPYPETTAADLCALYDRAAALGLPVASFMFHSSELMPGGSPYNPDEASIERLFERFDALFRHVTARGGRGVTLSEVHLR